MDNGEYIHLKHNQKIERGLSWKRYNILARSVFMVLSSRETGVSWCIDGLIHNAAQQMHQTSSYIYSIWMSLPKLLYSYAGRERWLGKGSLWAIWSVYKRLSNAWIGCGKAVFFYQRESMFCAAFLSRKSNLLDFSIKIGTQPSLSWFDQSLVISCPLINYNYFLRKSMCINTPLCYQGPQCFLCILFYF